VLKTKDKILQRYKRKIYFPCFSPSTMGGTPGYPLSLGVIHNGWNTRLSFKPGCYPQWVEHTLPKLMGKYSLSALPAYPPQAAAHPPLKFGGVRSKPGCHIIILSYISRLDHAVKIIELMVPMKIPCQNWLFSIFYGYDKTDKSSNG